MVKKKVKKKTTRKKALKKKIAKKKASKTIYTKKRFNLVLKNLLFFAVLSLVSYLLKNVSGQEIYKNLFMLLSIILGAIAVTFLVILLVLFFLKKSKK